MQHLSTKLKRGNMDLGKYFPVPWPVSLMVLLSLRFYLNILSRLHKFGVRFNSVIFTEKTKSS